MDYRAFFRRPSVIVAIVLWLILFTAYAVYTYEEFPTMCGDPLPGTDFDCETRLVSNIDEMVLPFIFSLLVLIVMLGIMQSDRGRKGIIFFIILVTLVGSGYYIYQFKIVQPDNMPCINRMSREEKFCTGLDEQTCLEYGFNLKSVPGPGSGFCRWDDGCKGELGGCD